MTVQENRQVHKQGIGVKYTQLLRDHTYIAILGTEEYKMLNCANLRW